MKHIILVFLCTVLTENISGQIFLNEQIKVDTLSVWLNVDVTIEDSMKFEIEEVFVKTINEFNSTEETFCCKLIL